MSEFVPVENGVPIRQPSTANLMVDTQDRTQGASASDFVISRNNSILNGYFTRIGVTEVVLEWFQGNIATDEDASFQFAESGGSVELIAAINIGFYTVETLLKEIASAMTTASAGAGGQTRTYTADSTYPGQAYITVAGANTFTIAPVVGFDAITQKLGLTQDTALKTNFVGSEIANPLGNGWTPDLRLYRYIDIVSSSLTYNQNLKDASTAQSVDNILCRWYFADDTPNQFDAFGYPILQGYTPFVQRRQFSPPKQIRWASNMPIGQLQFRATYTPVGTTSVPLTLPASTAFDWLMTLQVSEV